MPKIDLNAQEQTMLMECINTEIKSAKRAQNTGKTPHIREVYAQHERTLNALLSKVADARDTK